MRRRSFGGYHTVESSELYVLEHSHSHSVSHSGKGRVKARLIFWIASPAWAGSAIQNIVPCTQENKPRLRAVFLRLLLT